MGKIEIPYEKQAMREEPLPQGLEYPDQILYLSLRLLYKQYKMGLMNRESATEEKRKLLAEYDKNQYMHSMNKYRVELIKAMETAIWRYNKNKTIENADCIIDIFSGRPISKMEEKDAGD